MKNFKRVLLSLVLVFVALIALASCSKVSQSYADKINNNYQNKTNIVTYEEAKEALGDECIDITVAKTGKLVAVKGLNKDNYKEKLQAADADTKFSFIVITVVQGNCSNALYASGTANEALAATINLN